MKIKVKLFYKIFFLYKKILIEKDFEQKFNYEEIPNESDILVNNNNQFIDLIDDIEDANFKGRNSKPPKRVNLNFFILYINNFIATHNIKANHGARQCSSAMRKLKQRGYYKRLPKAE
jgi:hypothetical protein